MTKIVARARGRRLGTSRGRRIRVDLRPLGLRSGRVAIVLRVTATRDGKPIRLKRRRHIRLCAER